MRISACTVLSFPSRCILGLGLISFFGQPVFAAVPLPSTPTLNTPSNGALSVPQANVAFSWSVSNASTAKVSNYRIVISRDANFSGFSDKNGVSTCNSTCFTTTTGSKSSYTGNMSLAGQYYYWKVRANGSSGASGWSVARSFKTAGAVSLPVVDWSSSAYRSSNLFWSSGFAPKSFYTNGISKLGNAKGNCTWYAHGRLRQLGYTSNLTKLSGSAYTWSASASAAGISVDSTPTVGAIAQSTANRSIYGSYGHVAVVESINSDGSLLISESSYAPGIANWDFQYRTRTVQKSEFNNYIHVKK